MRSKIGIKSRLAAHILALILLIIMLVYLAPPQNTRSRPQAPAAPTAPAVLPAEAPVPPVDMTASKPEIPAQPEDAVPAEQATLTDDAPAEQPAEQLPESEAVPAESVPDSPEATPILSAPGVETPDEQQGEQPAEAPASESPAAQDAPVMDEQTEETETPAETTAALEMPAETESASEETGGDTEEAQMPTDSEPATATEPPPGENASEQPSPTQPDESGALVVAASDTGAAQPAAAPLYNANLEVLGDGVYWLGPQYDLEKELAAIPGLTDLIILAPLPASYKVHDFEHVLRDVIPADMTDLSSDAAERFLHFTNDRARQPAAENSPKPVVVVAAVHGARGAAFFKGVYLLFNRSLSFDEIEKRIEPELEEAGSARDEILLRLKHLKDQ